MALSKGHTFTSGEVVTPTKLNNLVDNATIGDDTITTAMIADDAVTADKIATGAVTSDALASDAVGASSIDDLTDVDTSTAAPSDGEGLIWNGTDSKWIPGSVSSGSGGSGIYQSSLSTDSGYTYFTNGMVIQWGKLSNVALNQSFHSVTWPVAFGVACDNVSATIHRASGSISGAVAPLVKSVTTTGCEIAGDHDTNTSTGDIYWTAIGRSAEQSSGGSGGGGTVTYLSSPYEILNVADTSSDSNNDTYVTYNIPSSVPTNAGGMILRFQARSHDHDAVGSKVEIFLKTSSYTERRVCYSYSNNNSDDSAADVNTFTVPYSSTIDVKFSGVGEADFAQVYIDGYMTGSSSSTSKYDSGWVTTDGSTSVANGATLTFTHGLNTSALTYVLYAATDSSGSDSIAVTLHPLGGGTSSSVTHGAQIQDITSTTLKAQLGTNGYVKLESDGSMDAASGTNYDVTFTYVRLVAIG